MIDVFIHTHAPLIGRECSKHRVRKFADAIRTGFIKTVDQRDQLRFFMLKIPFIFNNKIGSSRQILFSRDYRCII